MILQNNIEELPNNESGIAQKRNAFTSCFARIQSSLPIHFKICLCIALVSLTIHLTCSFIPSFSDFFTRYIASFFRTVTATVTGIFPFSLAETIILLMPIVLVIYFSLSYKHYIKNNNPIKSLVFGVISFVLAL